MLFFTNLHNRISRPFGQRCRLATKQSPHKTQLQVEALEAREVLNAALALDGTASASESPRLIAADPGREPTHAIELENVIVVSYSVSGTGY